MNSAQLKKILSTKQWNFNITRVEAEMIKMIKIREKNYKYESKTKWQPWRVAIIQNR